MMNHDVILHNTGQGHGGQLSKGKGNPLVWRDKDWGLSRRSHYWLEVLCQSEDFERPLKLHTGASKVHRQNLLVAAWWFCIQWWASLVESAYFKELLSNHLHNIACITSKRACQKPCLPLAVINTPKKYLQTSWWSKVFAQTRLRNLMYWSLSLQKVEWSSSTQCSSFAGDAFSCANVAAAASAPNVRLPTSTVVTSTYSAVAPTANNNSVSVTPATPSKTTTTANTTSAIANTNIANLIGRRRLTWWILSLVIESTLCTLITNQDCRNAALFTLLEGCSHCIDVTVIALPTLKQWWVWWSIRQETLYLFCQASLFLYSKHGHCLPLRRILLVPGKLRPTCKRIWSPSNVDLNVILLGCFWWSMLHTLLVFLCILWL